MILPHRSILSNCAGGFELLRPMRLRDEVYLSYLPAAHSYEHLVGQFFLPSLGTEIVYARGVEHLAADMLTVRPTHPDRGAARPGGDPHPRAGPGGAGAGVAAAAVRSGAGDRAQAAVRPRGSALAERLADPLLERLVRAKVRARFGGRLKGIDVGRRPARARGRPVLPRASGCG